MACRSEVVRIWALWVDKGWRGGGERMSWGFEEKIRERADRKVNSIFRCDGHDVLNERNNADPSSEHRAN